MYNLERLATVGTQNTRQSKNHNTIFVGYHYASTNTNHVIRYQPFTNNCGTDQYHMMYLFTSLSTRFPRHFYDHKGTRTLTRKE